MHTLGGIQPRCFICTKYNPHFPVARDCPFKVVATELLHEWVSHLRDTPMRGHHKRRDMYLKAIQGVHTRPPQIPDNHFYVEPRARARRECVSRRHVKEQQKASDEGQNIRVSDCVNPVLTCTNICFETFGPRCPLKRITRTIVTRPTTLRRPDSRYRVLARTASTAA